MQRFCIFHSLSLSPPLSPSLPSISLSHSSIVRTVTTCNIFTTLSLSLSLSSPSAIVFDHEEDQGVRYMQEVVPTEVLVHIFSYLRENDLINVGKVCRRFNQIGNLDSLWKNLFHRVFEMDEAYIVPEQSMSVVPDPMNYSQPMCNFWTWKEQFSIMVRERGKRGGRGEGERGREGDEEGGERR